MDVVGFRNKGEENFERQKHAQGLKPHTQYRILQHDHLAYC